MKMRRLVLEVVVPDDEFPTDERIIDAVTGGLMDVTCGSHRNVLALRPGGVRDFTDEEWKNLLEVSHK